jgi:hypothetical protein
LRKIPESAARGEPIPAAKINARKPYAICFDFMEASASQKNL